MNTIYIIMYKDYFNVWCRTRNWTQDPQYVSRVLDR